MSLSHYVSLGRSGLRVSPYCLGTMTFGDDWGWGSSVQESEAVLERYLALGGNFIDTANGYTKGHSEAILGEWFARHPGKRDRLTLATKFVATLYPDDPNGGGAGRKAIHDQLHHSLKRLKTDYIDLYWMHVWDRFTPIEETLQTLDDLVRAGKIRYIGFSDTPAWLVAKAQTLATLRAWTPLIALQIEYSLLQRTVEGELVPAALDAGVGITPWGALASGALSGKYTRANHGQLQAGRGPWTMDRLTEKNYDLIDALIAIGEAHNATPAQVALAWLQGRPGVASIIVGARTVRQLEDNLGAATLKLTDADRAKLEDLTRVPHAFPYDFCANFGGFAYGSTNVQGEQFERRPYAPQKDGDLYE